MVREERHVILELLCERREPFVIVRRIRSREWRIRDARPYALVKAPPFARKLREVLFCFANSVAVEKVRLVAHLKSN
jgi:hypothetical protein